ncbi:dGTPase [Marinobacter zhejiangensis]|uniref:Probable deoxyguanosinetriphosphate triphosphohydrolase n=1 Tax=Marinobacter zhejiangensis TaxID=488535 RepID=A0A1I4Q4P4_9GAMM|nr:dGTPase [Marinobacter zhejiangensis]SFM34635.1 dGTPase [Marinobacter zhejiangensis]
MSGTDTLDFASRFSLERPYNRARSNGSADYSLKAGGVAVLEDQLESDRGRIINSAAVRRLQQKTQVFPLEHNAAVRSRLTHSLEVQQTGRFIVRTIFRKLGARAEAYGLKGLERAMESLVEMACLMHDIGNPPFGHFGEAAISRWFQRHAHELGPFSDVAGPAELRDALLRELGSFEGNAQAIRLISRLQKLNLTFVQSAAVFKYTRVATEPRPGDGSAFNYLQKKPGYYYSERTFVGQMQQALGMAPGCRHPLAYIMEAADDISYCLADLEDGVDKGLMSFPVLADALKSAYAQARPNDADAPHFRNFGEARSFAQLVDEVLERANRETINKDHEFFVWLRVKLIHPLVNHAAEAFIEHISEVFHGRLNRALLEDGSPCHSVIETFKTVAVEKVFSVPEVETLELQGYRIITGLLEHYRPLLDLDLDAFDRLRGGSSKGLLIESRLFKRLPAKHVKAYESMRSEQPDNASAELWECYCRCRLLQDMVSGMTDQFALDEFRTLSALGPL